jgi:acetoin:2,6-dichlorophenolindophenol oxidoreductase subunit beta
MTVMTTIQAINQALGLKMAEDKRVFCLGEDIGWMGGDFGVTRGLFDEFGAERMRDTPLSEAAIIGTATGAAMVGMRPVAEIMFADFIGEGYDQFINTAAKMHYMFDGQFKVPMVVRAPCGAGFGGGPHHSQQVEGWFMNVPGMVMVAPTNPYDAKGLLIASIEDDNPILFLEHKALYSKKGEVPEAKYTVPLGKAKVLREGKDVTIVACMRYVYDSLDVAEELAKEGISCEVIDLRTIRPWDHETVLESVTRTGRAVVVNEAPKIGGLAADVSAVISEEAFRSLKAPVARVCGLDVPIPFSVPLEKVILPDKEKITAGIRKVIKG